MEKQIAILGAGLAGLLAASHFHDAKIYEIRKREDMRIHKALLRFRSHAIGEHLGIPFKCVKVKKGIYFEGSFTGPNPMVCNMYSQKVAGAIVDRSIWNLKEEERWIAPNNIHKILLNRFDSRITYESAANYEGTIISTAPLNNTIRDLKIDLSGKNFNFVARPITVFTQTIKNCDVYQTVYFPDKNYELYRASITGDQLIVECIGDQPDEKAAMNIASHCFGLQRSDLFEDGPVKTIQHYGKIKPINDSIRKNILFELTHKHNIYSLGRFAIWKNVVLDEVWQDISVIKKMINGTIYDAARHLRG